MISKDHIVSIIVPCYNQANYLEEALESVISQDYTNWECILVNDGSTDNTSEIALSFCRRDGRFKYYEKINGGLSSARNFGLKKSIGDLIQFLDADDILPPEKLSCHIQEIVNRDVDIVYGRNRRFLDRELSIWQYPSLEFPPIDNNMSNVFQRIILENAFVVHSALVRKEVFDKVGDFDESMKCMEDWDFWIRCSLFGCSFSYSSDLRGEVYYRIKSESMSTNKWNMRISNYKIYQKYYPLITNSNVKAEVSKRLSLIRQELIYHLYEFSGIGNGFNKSISEITIVDPEFIPKYFKIWNPLAKVYILGLYYSNKLNKLIKRITKARSIF